MRLTLLALLALAGCPEPADEHPFRVADPVAGATFDRCNIRVRTTSPVLDASWVQDDGLDALQHINWRIDGGRETEARLMSDNVAPGDRANTIFGVQLVDGAQTLEVGTCDEFDACAWTPVPVTVHNAIGAPDCRAYHGGQQMLEPSAGWFSTELSGGKLVLLSSVAGGVGMSLVTADGQVDKTFGTNGVTSIPWLAGVAAPHPDGGYLLFGQGLYLSRVSATGVYDSTWGNAGGTQGVRTIPCPGSLGCLVGALRSDGADGFWMAGMLPVAQGSTQTNAFIMRLDRDLAITAHTVFDVLLTTDEYGWRSFSIDPTGRVLAVARSFAVAGSLAGVDTSFATDGRADYPDTSTVVGALAGDQAVIVRQAYAGNEQVVDVRVFSSGVARPPIKLPAATDPVLDLRYLATAIDPTGSAYVAFARERAAEPGQFFDGIGTELVVARFVDGALDPAFGVQGYVAMTGRDLFERVSSESVTNNPTSIMFGPDQAPWVTSITQSSTDAWDPNVKRPPRLTLAKLRL